MDPVLAAPVLIVDDEEPNAILLRTVLERAGHSRLYTTTNSRQVLALVDEVEPDIILLDLHMPQPDGFAILQELASRLAPSDYLPVLVITADINEATKEHALTLGAKDFLSKPFNATEAVLRVRNLLQARLLHLHQRKLNETLEQKVQERTRDLEEAQFEILDRLALVSDFRDDVTGEHARRVGHSAELLARSLGIPPAEAELYRWASPLHDIGKVGIRDAILLKPGCLTTEEFERMKAHTSIGARLLAGSRFPILQLGEEIALTHHERWDGNGYMGLAGDDIPLSGRLVSVCDVFDALTHERPYKHAWPVDQALAEIASQRGLMFDPRVVDAFLNLPAEAISLD
jgi:putative two-component system response regulator